MREEHREKNQTLILITDRENHLVSLLKVAQRRKDDYLSVSNIQENAKLFPYILTT